MHQYDKYDKKRSLTKYEMLKMDRAFDYDIYDHGGRLPYGGSYDHGGRLPYGGRLPIAGGYEEYVSSKNSYRPGGIISKLHDIDLKRVMEEATLNCPYCSAILTMEQCRYPHDRDVISLSWTCFPCDKRVTQQVSMIGISYAQSMSYVTEMIKKLLSDVRKAFLDEPEFEGWAKGLDD